MQSIHSIFSQNTELMNFFIKKNKKNKKIKRTLTGKLCGLALMT